MALQFTALADSRRRQVRRQLPAARYDPAREPNGSARLSFFAVDFAYAAAAATSSLNSPTFRS